MNNKNLERQINALRDLEKTLGDKVEVVHIVDDGHGKPKIKKVITSKNPDLKINKHISLKVDVSSADQDNDELYHALL